MPDCMQMWRPMLSSLDEFSMCQPRISHIYIYIYDLTITNIGSSQTPRSGWELSTAGFVQQRSIHPNAPRRSFGATFEAKRQSLEAEFARKELQLREEQEKSSEIFSGVWGRGVLEWKE